MNNAQREVERAKYEIAYQSPKYRIKSQRLFNALEDLKAMPSRGRYLDVSCGRGDTLLWARKLGFARVQGTEIVPSLIDGKTVVQAWAHKLPFPDKSFDVVSMLDVIEHLIPGDDEAACKEMARVARRFVLLTANNHPSFNRAGDNLHINIRPYDEWLALFRQWFAPGKVRWRKRHLPRRGSETFIVEFV